MQELSSNEIIDNSNELDIEEKKSENNFHVKDHTADEVVSHSFDNNTNILVVSIDEADEYTTTAYKSFKPIKSTILLSTLIGSKNILGNSNFRKLTIPNIFTINESIIQYYKDGITEGCSINTKVPELELPSVNKLLELKKEDFKNIIEEICGAYERYNKFTISFLENLEQNKALRISDTLIFSLSDDLFLAVDPEEDEMMGVLLNLNGLKILLGDKM